MILTQLTSPGPLHLPITLADHSILYLDTLVRVLKGRRLVCKGRWNGQAVYAKLFMGKDAARYARRDADGAQAMGQAGIRTPDLLWHGTFDHQSDQVFGLLYAEVPHAMDAEAAYLQSDDASRCHLLCALVEVLARQHAANLCQTDLHLKNFLLADGLVWAIDGDGIRQQSISLKQSHMQLSELIAKLHVLDQMQMTEMLLQTYLKVRGWTETLPATQVLASAREMKTREVERFVARKLLRNCSDVSWHRDSQSAQSVTTAGGLHITDLPALEVAMHCGQVLKAGNTCTVVHTQLQDRAVVIKRYNIKNCWHALSRAWRPSRAMSSWQNAHRLRYYGMLTPQPLLMYERRFYGLRGRAYFVSAYSPWPDANTFFQQCRDQDMRQHVIEQLVTLCYQWFLLKISHGDMKASNLQVTDQGEIVVIDLDSMQQHRRTQMALRAHAKDIRRLLQNWQADTSLYNALVKSFSLVYQDHMPLKLAGISI
jgi:tRNA A-37 threonylcarbamoyl transferase component Bud32